jgi:hypothetical protein
MLLKPFLFGDSTDKVHPNPLEGDTTMQTDWTQYQRQQNIARYNRVKTWSNAASARLLATIRQQSGNPGLTPHLLHNWSLCGHYPELPSIKRNYDWKQRQIWDTASRLEKHFAEGF